jgi:predicted MPP superfamily phosphohydrolase
MKNEKVIKQVKLTKLMKYGDENYNNIEKTKKFWCDVEKTYITNVVNRNKSTKLINHGNENYNNSIKMINTKLEKYGFYFVNGNKAYDTKVKNGIIKTGDILSDWQFYRREVARFTRKNKKNLYENWDGNDYYDNELIKGYLSHTHTHRFYPTIDHKISVYFGFINNISPEEIGALDNLCITKRFINSMKGKLIENNFNI